MIKDKVKDLMDKLQFPLDDQIELLNTLDLLLKSDDFSRVISAFNNYDIDFSKALEFIKDISVTLELCEYTVNMIFILCIADELHNKYKQNNIDDKIYYDTMMDLKYKLDECKLVHGKVGTFVAAWYKRFFELKIFALGRLQFEINNTWFDCEVSGKKISKGTKVLSVHIPRTGTRLDHDLVLDSYKRAKEFFKDEFEGDIIFICNSWLLYPWNREILEDKSNLALFYDDFNLVETGEYKDYNESWRLFDCLYDGNVNNLPNNTSLRRAYIERIKSGKPLGYATGVIINI